MSYNAHNTQPRSQKPIHSERHVKIICIGAGASGLLFAYKLQRSFEKFELTVYEKNDDISGTWHENKYPGCACDIPAHNYTYSFEPKADWSAVYAGSDEIYKYFDTFSRKYDLRKYCKLKHEVVDARWDEGTAKWNIKVTNLTTGTSFPDNCDVFINASGLLNAWKWPEIPGLMSYKGTLLHTAKWDTNVDLTGKNIGLIGNGSSGIQVLPAIHDAARTITTFIREPTWVAPPMGLEQHIYSNEERKTFENNPGALLAHRKKFENLMNKGFSIFIDGSRLQKVTRDAMHVQMSEKLRDPDLKRKLIPTWSVGCRRITPGVGYLETLESDKVKVVYGDIKRITERGCVCDDGKEYPVEVLICATGFDTSFRPRFPIIGSGGRSLAEEWAEEPKSYLGLAAPHFPNYMIFAGPNSPLGNGPFLCVVEAQADYMLRMIDRWQTENIHSFSPKVEAVEDFIAHKDEFMKSTVWHQECRSWYKKNSASGKVSALWPGSSLHFMEAMAQTRYDDWNIKYAGNRFAYLGNGFSQTEADRKADLGYYIRNHDDSPYISRGRRLKMADSSGTVMRRPDQKARL